MPGNGVEWKWCDNESRILDTAFVGLIGAQINRQSFIAVYWTFYAEILASYY